MPDLGSLTGFATYAVVCGLVFIECGILLGLLFPGDSLLFAAGLLSADPASGVSVPLLAGAVTVSAAAGEAVGYAIGRRAGRPFLERRTGRVVNPANLRRAEDFFARHGALALVAARFVPWIRTLAPLLAGATRMPLPTFWAANIAGAVLWGAGLVVLGSVAGEVPVLRHLAVALVLVLLLWSLGAGIRRWRAGRRRPAEPGP